MILVNDVGQKSVDFFPGAVGDGPDRHKGQMMGRGRGGDFAGFQVQHRPGQVGDLGGQGGFGGYA